MKSVIYSYDIVQGLNQRKVITTETTRQRARDIKRTLDAKSPQQKHRIKQHRYVLSESQEIR